jgi:hypothetical protein
LIGFQKGCAEARSSKKNEAMEAQCRKLHQGDLPGWLQAMNGGETIQGDSIWGQELTLKRLLKKRPLQTKVWTATHHQRRWL